MDINTDSMKKVNDVNKRSVNTPDLRYSDSQERWTINESVQDELNLGEENGLVMYVALDEETGEQVVLVQIVDSEEADFFKGKGNVFTAHRLADAVDHHSFALSPIDDMENTYALRDWEGESEILTSTLPSVDDNEEESITNDLSDFAEEEKEEEVVNL